MLMSTHTCAHTNLQCSHPCPHAGLRTFTPPLPAAHMPHCNVLRQALITLRPAPTSSRPRRAPAGCQQGPHRRAPCPPSSEWLPAHPPRLCSASSQGGRMLAVCVCVCACCVHACVHMCVHVCVHMRAVSLQHHCSSTSTPPDSTPSTTAIIPLTASPPPPSLLHPPLFQSLCLCRAPDASSHLATPALAHLCLSPSSTSTPALPETPHEHHHLNLSSPTPQPHLQGPHLPRQGPKRCERCPSQHLLAGAAPRPLPLSPTRLPPQQLCWSR